MSRPLPPHLAKLFRTTPKTCEHIGREEWNHLPPFTGAVHPTSAIAEIVAAEQIPGGERLRAWLNHPDDRVLAKLMTRVLAGDMTWGAGTEMFHHLPRLLAAEIAGMDDDGVLWTHRYGLLRRLGRLFADPDDMNRLVPDLKTWAATTSDAEFVAVVQHIDDPGFDRLVGYHLKSFTPPVRALLRTRPALLEGVSEKANLDMHRDLRLIMMREGFRLLADTERWLHDSPEPLPEVGRMFSVALINTPSDDTPFWRIVRHAFIEALDAIRFEGLSVRQRAHLATQIAQVISEIEPPHWVDLMVDLAHRPGILREEYAASTWLEQEDSAATRQTLAEHTDALRVVEYLITESDGDPEIVRRLIDPTRREALAGVLRHAPAAFHDEAWRAVLEHVPDLTVANWSAPRGTRSLCMLFQVGPTPPAWVLTELAARSRDEGHALADLTTIRDLDADHVQAVLSGPALPRILTTWAKLAP